MPTVDLLVIWLKPSTILFAFSGLISIWAHILQIKTP